MSRVLLINPNWTGIKRQSQRQFKRLWQPLSLATAAALLMREGHAVRLVDNNAERLSPVQLGDLAHGFDQIFVTSTPYDRWQCPSLDIGFFFDTLAPLPRERLYILGSHVTERPGALLSASGARAAILGEPEETMAHLVRADDPAFPKHALADIPGAAFLDGGSLVTGPARPLIRDLDALPLPAFDLLPMGAYHYFPVMGKPFAILETSRGCPTGCSFCYLGMYGKKVRRKSTARALHETEAVVRRFGVKNLYFMDLEFGLSRRVLLDFCQGLGERGLGIRWACQTRVTDMDAETARAMADAGCNLVHFGVEAGSERVLAATGKGITLDRAREAVALCREAGIRTVLFMNFGFPGETGDEMEETIRAAVRLNPTYASFHLIVPFPGTPLARELDVDPESLPPDQYPQYNAEHDLAELSRVLKRAYRKFYMRPGWAAQWMADETRARRRP